MVPAASDLENDFFLSSESKRAGEWWALDWCFYLCSIIVPVLPQIWCKEKDPLHTNEAHNLDLNMGIRQHFGLIHLSGNYPELVA